MAGEQAFIDALKSIATSNAARGLIDDAAVLDVGPNAGSTALVITHDMLVEGVHFLPGTAPEDVAWKLAATNMSDLAAKGARPLGVMLGYMLRGTAWDTAFVRALGEALAHYQAPLLGGDTVGTGSAEMPRSFGLTAIGAAPPSGAPARSGAQAGYNLYLCGTIGDAMLGFEALRDDRRADISLVQSYLRPVALMEEGQSLAPYVSAMMDVSDGLLLDAYRMAEASNVTITINSRSVPMSAAARDYLGALSDDEAAQKHAAMLRWGDDYALLFAAPPSAKLPVDAALIGQIIARSDAPLMLDQKAIARSSGLGYVHDRAAPAD